MKQSARFVQIPYTVLQHTPAPFSPPAMHRRIHPLQCNCRYSPRAPATCLLHPAVMPGAAVIDTTIPPLDISCPDRRYRDG